MNLFTSVNRILLQFVLWLISLIGAIRIKDYSSIKRLPNCHEPFIIVANHKSYWDPVLVHAYAWKLGIRNIHFMAKQELFGIPLLGPLIRWLGAFPVDRENPGTAPIRNCIDFLDNNSSVMLFPEGHIKKTASVGEFKEGIRLLWKNNEFRVLCIGIQGAQYVRRVTMRSEIIATTKNLNIKTVRFTVVGLCAADSPQRLRA
jgi:1-acyl-sn-glycerol-3-phosphate acyltransferase